MLREPPLVENASMISLDFDWAMSWRRKITSTPTSFAIAVMTAGSSASEIAGIAAPPGFRLDAVEHEIRRVSRRASVAKRKDTATPRKPRADRCNSLAKRTELLGCDAPSELVGVARLSENRSGNVRDESLRIVRRFTQERIEKADVADALVMRNVFEKDVHRLVHRVAHQLEELLMNVDVVDGCGDLKIGLQRCRRAGPCDRKCAAMARGHKRAFQLGIALGRSECDCHVARSCDRRDKGVRCGADVERGKRTLSYQNGMNEFDRKMHRVGRVGTPTEGQ